MKISNNLKSCRPHLAGYVIYITETVNLKTPKLELKYCVKADTHIYTLVNNVKENPNINKPNDFCSMHIKAWYVCK